MGQKYLKFIRIQPGPQRLQMDSLRLQKHPATCRTHLSGLHLDTRETTVVVVFDLRLPEA